MYIVFIRERHCVSKVCTITKAIKNVKVKVDVRKGAHGLERKLTMDVLISSNSCFHSLLSYGNSPQ